jgi:hypothetical protein
MFGGVTTEMGECQVPRVVPGDVTVLVVEGWCPRMCPPMFAHRLVAELADPSVSGCDQGEEVPGQVLVPVAVFLASCL